VFKIFLKRQIHSNDKSDQNTKATIVQAGLSERRSQDRYEVKHGSLTFLNDFDMLLVKDLSLRGFHSQVPQRALKRLAIGDIYEARSRHREITFELEIKVAWQREDHVGFEFVGLDDNARLVIKRLIRPLEIAASMSLIDADFIKASSPSKTWYHGDDGSDLFIWHDERGFVCGWQFIADDKYLEWREGKGLESGALMTENSSESGLLDSHEQVLKADDTINKTFLHFTLDVLLALDCDEKQKLIATIADA
jgi:hypothetical protein